MSEDPGPAEPLVAVSLNQIEHAARKAARGAGLSWGLAEETGRAVRWLQSVEQPGVVYLLSLLQELDQATDSEAVPVSIEHSLVIAAGAEGTLLASAMLADCISASDFTAALGLAVDELQIEFSRPSPLTLGFAAVSAAAVPTTHLLQTGQFDAVIGQHSVAWRGSFWQDDGSGSLRLVAVRDRLPASVESTILRPQIQACQLYQRYWQQLDHYAARTYVAASEASRIAGAGAGLSDND